MSTSPEAPAGLEGVALGGFAEGIGLSLVSGSGDEVRMTLTLSPQLHQPYGIVHGGVYAAAVETAASIAAHLWLDGTGRAVGVANTTNFLRSASEGVLDVVARPIHRGRTQQLWVVDVTDARDRAIAHGEVRIANIPTGADVLAAPAS